MDELVGIRKKDLLELIQSDVIFNLLKNGGVDNWPGFEFIWNDSIKKLNLDPDDPDVTEEILDHYVKLDFKYYTTR